MVTNKAVDPTTSIQYTCPILYNKHNIQGCKPYHPFNTIDLSHTIIYITYKDVDPTTPLIQYKGPTWGWKKENVPCPFLRKSDLSFVHF